jgi:hypothetical protein
MKAIEFSAQIQKGVIHLPPEYSMFSNDSTKIIVLFEDSTSLASSKELLLKTFDKMQTNKMFENIENPDEW